VSARPPVSSTSCGDATGTSTLTLDLDDVFDVLLGAIVARTLIPTLPIATGVERLVDMTRCSSIRSRRGSAAPS